MRLKNKYRPILKVSFPPFKILEALVKNKCFFALRNHVLNRVCVFAVELENGN